MDIEQVKDARLEGYEDPIFPEEVKKLNEIFSTIAGKIILSEAVKELRKIKNVKKIYASITTTDRYTWSFALSAQTQKRREVIILFPRALKPPCIDRSVAVYVKSIASMSLREIQEIDILLERIQLRFHRAQET